MFGAHSLTTSTGLKPQWSLALIGASKKGRERQNDAWKCMVGSKEGEREGEKKWGGRKRGEKKKVHVDVDRAKEDKRITTHTVFIN